MVALSLAAAFILLMAAQGGAGQKCASAPDLKIVGECFWVHGRMYNANGGSVARIWKIGTRRILGVESELPKDIEKSMGDFDDEVYADFLVCPYTKEEPGVMQLVCVKDAKHLIPRKRSDNFHSALRPIQSPPPLDEQPSGSYVPVFHTLSPAEKAHILDREFSIEKGVDRLPDSLKSAFARLAGEPDFKMANPGEKYQETDVISEQGLPFRRLLFAGISNDRYFIHYEQGGIGHSYHVAVFGVDPGGKVRFLWGGPGFRAAKDLEQLRTMISAGTFADDRAYYW
jgi:hypothetical protein